MKASLRYLHSPDLSDLEHAAPPDPENFCILLQAMIGPEDGKGEESFDFLLCTPKWLMDDLGAKAHLWGRHYLLVPRYDFASILKAVTTLCSDVEAPDWKSTAAIISRYGKWEFEDLES